MKNLICYTTNRHKTTKIIIQFAAGVNKRCPLYNAQVIEIKEFNKKGIPSHAHAVMSLGILRGTGLMFKQAAKQGLDRYFLDHAYFEPGYSGKGWMRLSKNRHTMNWVKESKGERWQTNFRDRVPVTPWLSNKERGSNILICPPTDAVGWYFECRDWETRAVEYVKSQIPQAHHHLIQVRRKPGGPIVDDKGNLVGKEPDPVNIQPSFNEELKNTNFVIAYNSMVALEAVRKGYPVITDIHNCCASVSFKWEDIKALHNKDLQFDIEPNRKELFYWLSDNQFTVKELKSGSAWSRALLTDPPEHVKYSEPF